MISTLSDYYVGQPTVYCLPKNSTEPRPRTMNLHLAEHGDAHSYEIEKYWAVDEVLGDGRLVLRTRTGKTHVVLSDDPHLRIATWWEQFWYRGRFPQPMVP